MNFRKLQMNKGMTYVELIVVLSIAGLVAGVSLFNYKEFQERVDMKNLANDIALKITEAQKNSISGKLPLTGTPYPTWKPSYGVFFSFDEPEGNKNFYLFTDLDQNKAMPLEDIGACPQNECLAKITLSNKYYINKIWAITQSESYHDIYNLNISFTRPNSGAIFTNKDPAFYNDIIGETVLYFNIELMSADGSTSSNIRIYPSGRIEII